MIRLLILGLLARVINVFIPVQKKHWAFASDFGNMYREGSKYLLEYMLSKHSDYKCTFFTKSKNVYYDLKSKGIPCKLYTSWDGIKEIAKCEAVFTTQVISDIRFAYKKKNRKYYYLVHGMPFKKAMAMLPNDYVSKLRKIPIHKQITNKISYYLTLGYTMSDVSFVSACSEFLSQFQAKEFPNCNHKILGMPRNDALFDDGKMSEEKWIEGVEDKIVITYMPTHRGYGMGEVCPIPFANNIRIQKWFEDNRVVLLVKQHPNMIDKIKDCLNSNVIIDITKYQLDPQVCIYHSDVLITDYSSVWMDYLILQRPLIFYWYDDFEKNDVGTYYDLKKIAPGSFCRTEEELFEVIKKIRNNYNDMKPSVDIVSKYHKYTDGNSCERYYNEVVKDLTNIG